LLLLLLLLLLSHLKSNHQIVGRHRIECEGCTRVNEDCTKVNDNNIGKYIVSLVDPLLMHAHAGSIYSCLSIKEYETTASTTQQQQLLMCDNF
jgi:hypothetical protein